VESKLSLETDLGNGRLQSRKSYKNPTRKLAAPPSTSGRIHSPHAGRN
jgi:hypothetical protein